MAIGGGLLGLTAIPEVGDSSPLRRTLELLGGVSIVAGIVGFGLPYLPRPPDTDYDHRKCRRADLKLIFALCDELFDGEVSSLNLMKKWYRHNGDIFWVVERTRQRRGFKETRLVGYFCIIPLTESAKDEVLADELPGTSFSLEHIASSPGQARAFYIGGVGANMWRARAPTLSYLKARIQILIEQYDLPIVTRPITEDGLRLAEKYDFYPVRDDGVGKVYTRIASQT